MNDVHLHEVQRLDHVVGDATGLEIPAHPEALRAGGVAFLTRAFRTFGAISATNRVTRITRFDPCPGGSTGKKLFLSVEYAQHEPGLHRDLFVKFSRDFEDALRDRVGKHELESETRFAAITRLPGFPISVPAGYFADYNAETSTGVLITERIFYGQNGIEPQLPKCRDHELDDAQSYYRAVLTALAKLSGAHKAGRLAADIEERFPYDPEVAVRTDLIPHDEAQLRALVARYAEFGRAHPHLLPEAIRTPDFIARLERDLGPFLAHEAELKRFLHSDRDYVALCHWNANIDNAWFWRDAAGELQCGFIDWGRVNQMNLVAALFGCLFTATVEVLETELDDLLTHFIDAYAAAGGPQLQLDELKLHLDVYVAMMSLAWMLEFPQRILLRLPEAANASGPRDPIFLTSEPARNQLHCITVVMHLWRQHDFGAQLERVLARNRR
jgi:hypothetical protein